MESKEVIVNPNLPHLIVYRRMTQYFCQFLKPDVIRPYLLEKGLIDMKTNEKLQKLIDREGPYAATEHFLTFTLMREPEEEKFHQFLQILAENGGQEFLASKLREELEKVKGKPEGSTTSPLQENISEPMEETGESDMMELQNTGERTGATSETPGRNVDYPVTELALAAGNNEQTPLTEYKITGELKYDQNDMTGKGSFGSVFTGSLKEHNDIAEKECAVKDIHEQFHSKEEIQKFVHDNKEIMAGVKIRHPQVVDFYGYTENFMRRSQKYSVFLVFELVDGQDLNTILHPHNDEIKAKFKLDNLKRSGIAKKICEAMAYIHQKRVIHRDIKPANILVTNSFDAKLCDLGLCTLREGIHKSASATVGKGKHKGTPLYMAIEFFKGIHGKQKISATCASDVFSFGATMFELYTGKNLWGLDEDANEDDLNKAIEANYIPQELQNHGNLQPMAMIGQCVDHDPHKRPTAEEILQTLWGTLP